MSNYQADNVAISVPVALKDDPVVSGFREYVEAKPIRDELAREDRMRRALRDFKTEMTGPEPVPESLLGDVRDFLDSLPAEFISTVMEEDRYDGKTH